MVAYLAIAGPVFGQPEDTSAYDLRSTTEIRGEVAIFGAVPGGNAEMLVAAPDSHGAMRQWTVVMGKAGDMRKAGMTPFTFAPGVQVVITGNPGANPTDYRILAQKVTTADGFAWTRPPPTP
jgi:hypothetical protein